MSRINRRFNKLVSILSVIVLLFLSCAPTVRYRPLQENKSKKPVDYDVIIYRQGETIKKGYSIIGKFAAGHGDFDCGYTSQIRRAKQKARSVGGDAIQITYLGNGSGAYSYCTTLAANVIIFEDKTPLDWLTKDIDEQNCRDYLDNNTLDPIEGIWNINLVVEVSSVKTGQVGAVRDTPNAYRICIQKDLDDSYDYVASIIESEYEEWPQGRIKAKFRRTAYPKIYDGVWFMKDYSKNTQNYIISESGIIEYESKKISSDGRAHIWQKATFIKAYPYFSEKASFKSDNSKDIKSTGSGFIISNNGLVVTNYHVIEDANIINVYIPEIGITKEASLKMKDKNNDLAILEINNFSTLEFELNKIPFSFGDMKSAKIGQEVFTLGFPLGSILGSTAKLSTGKINSLYGIDDNPSLLQIGNPLQPGNSGGPLFNMHGELVGVVVSGLNAKYFYENLGIVPQNVNFAIKVIYLKNLISMLPEGDAILNRKSAILGSNLEEQVEKYAKLIVQVRVN